MDDLEGDDGSAISIGGVLETGLEKLLSKANLTYDILFPQKVCPGVGDDIPTRGTNSGVEACKKLDMLNDTDMLVFGYHNNHLKQGLCVAFNDDTHTYAFGQVKLLPDIKIQALTITINALAVSLTKQLQVTTLNKMWDGTTFPVELTLPGHFVLRGTGSMGIKVSDSVELTLSCDTTVLVDADYANNVSISL